MGLKKLSSAAMLVCFAAFPASATETVRTQGLFVPTAACSYGYAKNKKTRECVELICKKNETLDLNGHKCIRKTKKNSGYIYRGSH